MHYGPPNEPHIAIMRIQRASNVQQNKLLVH